MKKEKERREGNFTLTGRLICKTSTKEKKKRKISFFFFHYINRTENLENRKQTICAMLVSVHYTENVQLFLPLVLSSVNTANHNICISHIILEFPSISSRISWFVFHSSSSCGAVGLPATTLIPPNKNPTTWSVLLGFRVCVALPWRCAFVTQVAQVFWPFEKQVLTRTATEHRVGRTKNWHS